MRCHCAAVPHFVYSSATDLGAGDGPTVPVRDPLQLSGVRHVLAGQSRPRTPAQVGHHGGGGGIGPPVGHVDVDLSVASRHCFCHTSNMLPICCCHSKYLTKWTPPAPLQMLQSPPPPLPLLRECCTQADKRLQAAEREVRRPRQAVPECGQGVRERSQQPCRREGAHPGVLHDRPHVSPPAQVPEQHSSAISGLSALECLLTLKMEQLGMVGCGQR